MRLLSSRLLILLVVLTLGAAACGSGGGQESVGGDLAEPTTDGESASSSAGHKITVAGDSISVGLGAALRQTVPDGVEVVVIGEEGTGLARPEIFDWPERLERLARDFPPEVLVLSLASNDAQDLLDVDGSTVAAFADADAWDAEYSRRLAAAVDPFEDTGTLVVWVGHVRTAEEQVGSVNRRVHRLAEAVAAERDWMEVADLAELLGTGEDEASRCLEPDGLHLSLSCLDEAAAGLTPQVAPR
ncbi:MAG: DUF459 domain-containing protein [Acidimicrobiia bacterium]|nr:DUF459 domain-containing protein [Acidimicrobiia bacterium]